jgi:hypothetical protein
VWSSSSSSVKQQTFQRATKVLSGDNVFQLYTHKSLKELSRGEAFMMMNLLVHFVGSIAINRLTMIIINLFMEQLFNFVK